MKQVQDFYKATITQDWSIGTGIFYVSVKPTITEGWLYVSPNNPALREQIYYNGVGTDGNGDYITVTQRGMGSTDEQTHTIGEPVRMNVGEGYIEYLTDAIEDIIAAGTPDADTSTAGKVEIATDAEVIAGTETGGTDAMLVVTPKTLGDNFKTIAYNKIVAPIVRVYTSNATWTKPAGLKYIEVEVQAGGGGGGYRTPGGGGSPYYSSGGGGGYSKKTIASETLGATEAITIGVGGTGSTGSSATDGGTSSFGSHLSATGGKTGILNDAYNSGRGGVGSGGDINITGQSGYISGGNSFLGFGASILTGERIGESAGYGGGGLFYDGTTDKASNGAPGIVIVKEFYI